MSKASDITPQEARVAASSTLGLIHHLRERDCLDEARVETILGQPMATLGNPDHRVLASRHYQLWDHAEAITGDPAIGLHAGATADTDRMGLAGHVFFNADTLGAAASQYVRLHRLINESVSLRLEQTDERATLIWSVDDPDHYCRQDMDRTLAATICRTRHFMQVPLDIARVRVAHPAPDYADVYHELLQCPVEFGAPVMELAFDVRYLNRRLPHRNPYVYSAVLKQVNALLSRVQSRRRFSRKVRGLIARQLASEHMDADTLASQLHMSRQTLYRRLKKEGLSFHTLVEQVRRDRALRYVSDDRYALGEIAFLLGFSELSAFSRAFKRWTGESPAHYREQHRPDSEVS